MKVAVRDGRRAAARRPRDQAARRCAASNRRACCARRRSSASPTTRPACSRLPPTRRVGADLRDALALDDALITLKLTPNRADCLSLVGIARDVAAITGAPLAPPGIAAVAGRRATRDARCASRTRRRARASCRRTIDGIDPRAPTPRWMKQRLERSGIRSISAVVDITNYVMLELGQPLHAYDDRLLDGAIVVRFARAGEKLTLLNGQMLDSRARPAARLRREKPLGLAGIMGGEHSGISDTTTTVLLEGAFWNPAVIQGKIAPARLRERRRLSLRARRRLRRLRARGRARDAADPRDLRRPRRAARRRRGDAAARATPCACAPRASRACSASPCRRRRSRACSSGCGFALRRATATISSSTPPSYRFDLAIEEDFVEEIARLYGYDAIPATPVRARAGDAAGPGDARVRVGALKRATRRARLAGSDHVQLRELGVGGGAVPERDASAAPIAVLNPIAEHLDVMRTTLAGGLLDVLRTQPRAQAASACASSRSGRCFVRDGDGYRPAAAHRRPRVRRRAPEQWGVAKRAVDFFDVKGDLEALVGAARARRPSAPTHPALHPGRAARVLRRRRGGRLAGRAASAARQGSSSCRGRRSCSSSTSTPLTARAAARRRGRCPSCPSSAATSPSSSTMTLPAQRRRSPRCEAARPPQVEAVRLFDVYRGAGLPPGKKSLAILVLMQDTERTLTDAEIDATVARAAASSLKDDSAPRFASRDLR